YIDVTYTVDSAGSYQIGEGPTAGFALNLTGQTWTGFELQNLSPELGSFDTDWIDGHGNFFLTPADFPTDVNFSGGNNVSDGCFTMPYGHFVVSSAGTCAIREFPVVPEPSSVVLLIVGSLGLGGLAYRRRARYPRTG